MRTLTHLTAAFVLTSSLGCKTLNNVLQSAFQEPDVSFVQLHLRELSLESVTLDFEMKVDNPNSVGVTLESLDYRLAVDGHDFATGKSDRQMKIAAKGSAPVRLPLTVKFNELVEGVALLLSDRDSVPYQLGVGFGLATPVGELRLPIDNEGEVPLPKLPEVQFGGVELKNVSLTGARIEVAVDVKNRGSFPIKPQGLRYDLSLAGVGVSSGDQKLPEIGATAAQRVVLPVQLDFLKVGAAAVKAVQSKKLPYKVEGELDLGLFKRPFTVSGVAPL